MTDPAPEISPLAKLREPFPASVVGILPKPYKRDSPIGLCDECGQRHGLPAVHLNYVGHAAVTDRLLSADIAWTWEPMAVTDEGLPVLDRDGGLWIKLTVAGVTRLGYGDGPDNKQRIGDAIRNAAMRFGVALDLWTKDELESLVGNEAVKASRRRNPPRGTSRPPAIDPASEGRIGASAMDKNRILRLLSDEGLTRASDAAARCAEILGHEVVSVSKLDADEATKVLAELDKK